MVLTYRRNPRLVFTKSFDKKRKSSLIEKIQNLPSTIPMCFKMKIYFKTLAKASSFLFQKKKKVSLLLQI
jgi:hypothetical protein